MQTKYCNRKLSLTYNGTIMNQKAKDYIRRNTLDLESDNRRILPAMCNMPYQKQKPMQQ